MFHKIRISTFLHNILTEYIEKINSSNNLYAGKMSGSGPDKPIPYVVSEEKLCHYICHQNLRQSLELMS